MYTAHVVVRLVCLDVHKKPIRECDMVYIYKKILDEWKIYVISEADDMQRDTTVSVEAWLSDEWDDALLGWVNRL